MTSSIGWASRRNPRPPQCPGCGAYMRLGNEIVEKPLQYEPQYRFRAWYACPSCCVWRTSTFYGPTMSLAIDKAYKNTQNRRP